MPVPAAESSVSKEPSAAGPVLRPNDTTAVLLGLAPMWIAFAWLISKAQWHWNHRPDMQFGWLVLMLCAFLLWDSWERRPVPKFRAGWPLFAAGAIGAALLFLMQIYQAAYGMMPAVLMGLTAGTYGIAFANVYYVYGWAGARFFAFPLLFFAIALPLPSFIYNPVVGGLQRKVAAANVELLNVFGIPAQQVGSVIQLPNGAVGVDEACSGIRSLQSAVMATLFIGYITLRRRSLQFVLLAAGIALAIFGNLIRSLWLSLTANARGLDAVKQVHDSAGWTILIFTGAGVALAAWAFNRLEKWLRLQEPRGADR